MEARGLIVFAILASIYTLLGSAVPVNATFSGDAVPVNATFSGDAFPVNVTFSGDAIYGPVGTCGYLRGSRGKYTLTISADLAKNFPCGSRVILQFLGDPEMSKNWDAFIFDITSISSALPNSSVQMPGDLYQEYVGAGPIPNCLVKV